MLILDFIKFEVSDSIALISWRGFMQGFVENTAARFLSQHMSEGVMMPDAWWYWWKHRQFGSTSYKTSSSKGTWLIAEFDVYPELVDLDITEETVSKTAGQLKGAAGEGGQTQKQLHHGCWSLEPTAKAFGMQWHGWQSGCQMTSLLGLPSHCTWQKSRSSSPGHRRSIATTYC